MSTVWEMFQEITESHKTLTVKEIKIADMFYKIQNFLRISKATIITTHGITFKMAEHLIRDVVVPIKRAQICLLKMLAIQKHEKFLYFFHIYIVLLYLKFFQETRH